MLFAKAVRGTIRQRNAPAFLAGVVVLLLTVVVSCGKNIDNSSAQLQRDKKIIAAWIADHCLTPEGDIIALSQVPASASQGYIPLEDTAQAVGNMYIVHIRQGKGDRGTSYGRALIHFQGYYLHDMQVFDSVWGDQAPYSLWISGSIQGFRSGLPAMRSGTPDATQPSGYASPGEAWFILPSTMAFGQDGREDPPVPSNTCVAYRVIFYGVGL